MAAILWLMVLAAGPAQAQAQAETGFARTDPPAWVELGEVPGIDPNLRPYIQGGVAYLLGDRQIRWDGDVEEDYYRNVRQVIDRAGLEEAATVSYGFDPEYDELVLTRLQILRGAQVIDLRDSVRSETFRREKRLEEGIIDGTLTAVLQIPDLRVGDIIDSAVLVRSRSVLPGAPRADVAPMEFGEPVTSERLRLHWPKDRPFYVESFPSRISYTTSAGLPGEVVHEWRSDGYVPTPREDQMPAGHEPRASIRFSEAGDWSSLVQSLRGHYLKDYPLTPEWEARIEAIRTGGAAPADQATAALRMVQDEIRYVSLSVGAGGYFARSPEEVIASGFGDCKDKSLLLKTLLRRLNITGDVALADIDAGHALGDALPAAWAFDHMIVRVTLDGVPYWVDPTATHEGGIIGIVPNPDLGMALPIVGGLQHGLEPIAVDPYSHWVVSVQEDYRFSFAGVFFTVNSTYSGEAANNRRRDYAVTPIASKSDDFFDYYAGRYPGLQLVRPLAYEDDTVNNYVTLRESYFLPGFALFENGLREDFVFAAENFASNIPDITPGSRKEPLDVGGPSSHYHTITVSGAPIDFDVPETVNLSNAAFDFWFEGFTTGLDNVGDLTMQWSFTRRERAVPAQDVDQVVEDAEVVKTYSWWSWNLIPEHELKAP